jgi:cell volume regulation protein A
VEKAPYLILLLAGLMIAALFLSRLSERLRMPDILWFMLLGLLLGPSGFGLLSDSKGILENQTLLMGAVGIVLYEAGVRTQLDRVGKHMVGIGLLVTVGLLLTSLLLGIGARLLFGMTFYQGLLLGAVLSTTDPASILPILRRLPLPESVTATLIAESALGDVTGSMMTMFILSLAAPESGFLGVLWPFAGSVLWGASLGVVLGMAVRLLLTHEKIGIFRENVPVLMISALLAGFSLSILLHGQTLLLAYVFGIMVGRMSYGPLSGASSAAQSDRTRDWSSLKTLNDLLFYLASFFIFFVMGTLIPKSTGGVSVVSLVLFILFLVLAVRPIVVFTLVPLDRSSRFSVREMSFMAIVRETGIMAGALLGLAHARLPESAPLIVFVVVVSTVVIGAVGSASVARKLGFMVGHSDSGSGTDDRR